jgi:hypothetical protein
MTKLEQIQLSIEQLSANEIARLREWLDELDERLFDEKIEHDAKSGKLDKLAAAARRDHKRGLSRKL